MKNLNAALPVLLVLIFSVACNRQNDVVPTQPKFVEVTIPDAYKANESGQGAGPEVDDLILDIQMTSETGKEVFGKLHLIMPDNGTLKYLAVTENILKTAKLTPDFWKEALNQHLLNGRKSGSQGCFATCRGMKKGQGRGTCKALCWLQVVKDVALVFATVVTISKA